MFVFESFLFIDPTVSPLPLMLFFWFSAVSGGSPDLLRAVETPPGVTPSVPPRPVPTCCPVCPGLLSNYRIPSRWFSHLHAFASVGSPSRDALPSLVCLESCYFYGAPSYPPFRAPPSLLVRERKTRYCLRFPMTWYRPHYRSQISCVYLFHTRQQEKRLCRDLSVPSSQHRVRHLLGPRRTTVEWRKRQQRWQDDFTFMYLNLQNVYLALKHLVSLRSI